MALFRSSTADKFIVDRRRQHRNSEVARAVRRTRDRLAQQLGTPNAEREFLRVHSRKVLDGALILAMLLLVVTVSGYMIGFGLQIVPWSIATLVAYVGLGTLAMHIKWTDQNEIEPASTRRNFLAAHFATGLPWAYFVTLECGQCMSGQLPILQAAVLLLVMAGTAVYASSLSGALSVTFGLPIFVYIIAIADLTVPGDAVMSGLLVAALPFMSYIARHFNQTEKLLMSFRLEMDGLLAELDTATSLSDEARRRAEEANLAKSRFLASISHELRTPLNAILGFSEVMANEVLGPMQNESYRSYANDIHSSGQHLLDLINEILDLSRIEAGRYTLNEEPVSLLQVADECCHMMGLKARNKDISIIQQFEPSLPRLFGDEKAIRQIALNLLSNAVKFTPQGGEVRVRVGWTAGGGQYLSVTDNGPGIPPEEIPIVLSAFGQGAIAIKSAEQGTGLGLPIVQGLIAMHGGELKLHSKLREGTEAIVFFPASRIMDELPAVPARVARAASR